MKTIRPYGLWDSPLSPRSLAGERKLDAPQWDRDGTLVWLEQRSGKGVLVAQSPGDDAPRDLTSDLSVRAEVGYGGGDFTVHGGHVFFVVHKTGRIYRQALAGGIARPITPPFGQAASPAVSPDGRWLAYVHSDGQMDCIAVVDAAGRGWPQILAGGHDFYMQPRFSPDGQHVTWIAWDHPNMPWDGTTLYLAPLVALEGAPPRLGEARAIAGGRDTAVFQPEFTPDGRRLLFVSDETGWGRIGVHDLAKGLNRWITPDGVEHGAPAWVQGLRTYCIAADGRSVVAARNELGFQRAFRIDVDTGENHSIAALEEYSQIDSLAAAPSGSMVALAASSPVVSPRVVVFDLTSNRTRIAARAAGETLPAASLAQCQPLTWNSAGGEPAHGLFYPPANDAFQGSGRPPLIVQIHGGPTSQYKAGWRPDAQFFATRGYAVLLVNYRGSTGHGRPYMLRLRGNWGICDVEDAVSAVRHLAESGLVDGSRAVIMGGSAGGFTVLQTMVRQPEAFAAGISLYGVANQFTLAADTHKFESRYLDSMLGPLPEAAAVYRERSPVFHAQNIRRPLALFQGDIDKVVPKDQSDSIADALRRNGTSYEYHVYKDEGHGWRKSETIEHFYQAVDGFLRSYVLFA